MPRISASKISFRTVTFSSTHASGEKERSVGDGMLTDSELVLRSRMGEQGAFDALVRRYHDVVRRIATSFAAIPEDADDLVQETFVTAYSRLGQLKDPDRFGAWIAAITRNEGRMWHLRRQREIRPQALLPRQDHHRRSHDPLLRSPRRPRQEPAEEPLGAVFCGCQQECLNAAVRFDPPACILL